MTPILRRFRAPVLAVAVAILAGAASLAGAAESGTERADGSDRSGVDTVTGKYILLDPLWVTITDPARDRTHQGGILVRLEPDPAHKVEACYAVPDIVDALVIDFHDDRLTRAEHKRPGHIVKRVQAVVDRVAGKGLFAMPEVFEQVPDLDADSVKLSSICR